MLMMKYEKYDGNGNNAYSKINKQSVVPILISRDSPSKIPLPWSVTKVPENDHLSIIFLIKWSNFKLFCDSSLYFDDVIDNVHRQKADT